MATGKVANANVPHIDQPLANLQSLVSVTMRLKEGVETLSGNRGDVADRAATFNDLVSVGLLANPGDSSNLVSRVATLEGGSKTPTTPTTPASGSASDVAALQASVTDLNTKVAAHDVSIVTLNYQMAQTTTQISNLWADSTYQENQIVYVTNQVNDLGTRVYNLEVHAANIDSEISNLSTRVSHLESRLAAAGIP